jgi:hypothetical protein
LVSPEGFQAPLSVIPPIPFEDPVIHEDESGRNDGINEGHIELEGRRDVSKPKEMFDLEDALVSKKDVSGEPDRVGQDEEPPAEPFREEKMGGRYPNMNALFGPQKGSHIDEPDEGKPTQFFRPGERSIEDESKKDLGPETEDHEGHQKGRKIFFKIFIEVNEKALDHGAILRSEAFLSLSGRRNC